MPRRSIYKSSAPVLTDGEQHQFLADSSGNLMVNVAASDGSSITEYTEDVAAAADPLGPMILARRKDTLTTAQVSADGDNIALNATSKGELHTANLRLEALLPTALGSAAAAASLAVTDSTEDIARAGIITETAPATDTASSGLNGRLQRIAQRLTSLIALVPASLGAKAGASSFSVVPATDASYATQATVITVTPTVDATALGAGDVAFDVATITGAARATGSAVTLDSITITDVADQKAQLHLVFFNAATSLGVVNSVPDIDDTELLTVVGHYEVAAASWIDLGANAVFSVGNLRKQMKTNADANLYVAGFTTGTPTYGAATALQFRFGFIQH